MDPKHIAQWINEDYDSLTPTTVPDQPLGLDDVESDGGIPPEDDLGIDPTLPPIPAPAPDALGTEEDPIAAPDNLEAKKQENIDLAKKMDEVDKEEGDETAAEVSNMDDLKRKDALDAMRTATLALSQLKNSQAILSANGQDPAKAVTAQAFATTAGLERAIDALRGNIETSKLNPNANEALPEWKKTLTDGLKTIFG